MGPQRWLGYGAFTLAYLFIMTVTTMAQTTILNVSYDVSRELYKEINPAFAAAYKAKSGEAVTVNQSHGGSSKQALSVIGGLEADVVTMNQAPDIDVIAQRAGLIDPNWRKRLPYDATPYTTVTVFLVRKGNPKAIRNWPDLVRPGLQVIVPNPKTSGNGRYTYLAAWGYALKTSGDEAGARDFVTRLFANVPVLDGGGRGATTTFTQRDTGDVLVTFENEALAISAELGADKFDIVYPAISIEASAPVALVDKVADKRGTRAAATAYLQFLFGPEGQAIIARHSFRPRDPAVLASVKDRFPEIDVFTVEANLGGWETVQSKHFADGALYDQISQRR